jgi:hydrogenase maturation protein HypF
LPDLTAAPFNFGLRYQGATQLVRQGIRTFATTSMGRLFDVAAALLGFVRETTFEGQAAIWLEQMARGAANTDAYPFPFTGEELDFRPLLECVIRDRVLSRPIGEIARAFQRGIAHGLLTPIKMIAEDRQIQTVVLSGGVFQNEMLLADLKPLLEAEKLEVWTNHAVPPNDGGISLGQAALAAFAHGGVGGARHA